MTPPKSPMELAREWRESLVEVSTMYGVAYEFTDEALAAIITADRDAQREADAIEAAERRVEELTKALGFGPPEEINGMMVSHDAYENIGGAIIDIENSDYSPADLRTLKRVEDQLYKAREILGGPQWHKPAPPQEPSR